MPWWLKQARSVVICDFTWRVVFAMSHFEQAMNGSRRHSPEMFVLGIAFKIRTGLFNI